MPLPEYDVYVSVLLVFDRKMDILRLRLSTPGSAGALVRLRFDTNGPGPAASAVWRHGVTAAAGSTV